MKLWKAAVWELSSILGRVWFHDLFLLPLRFISKYSAADGDQPIIGKSELSIKA